MWKTNINPTEMFTIEEIKIWLKSEKSLEDAMNASVDSINAALEEDAEKQKC